MCRSLRSMFRILGVYNFDLLTATFALGPQSKIVQLRIDTHKDLQTFKDDKNLLLPSIMNYLSKYALKMGNSSCLLQKSVQIKENSEPVVLLKYTKKPEYHQSVDSNQIRSEAQHNGVKYFLKKYS